MTRRASIVVLAFALMCPALIAQEVEPKAPDPVALLNAKANRIAAQYLQLEQLLRRMAEIEAVTNPQRAALLKRAAQQSAERRTKKRLDDVTTYLVPPGKLKQAVDDQAQALADMQSLLELLLSEDRADRLKAEENRIREYIKEVERLIRLQRSAEGRTRGGADAQRLADEQDRIANRTEKLADTIRENEEGEDGEPAGDKKPDQNESKPNDGEQGENKSEGENQPGGEKSEGGDKSEGDKPKDGEKTDGENKEGKKPDGESKPKEGDKPESDKQPGENEPKEGDKPAESGKEGEQKPGEKSPNGESQEGQPQEGGEPSDQQQQQSEDENANPARKRLQAAEERMREAQRRLEEAKRDKAVEEQEKAREELNKAKAELEEILRQLREEEIGRTLAMLEGRFARMLQKQLEIYESTKRLDKVELEKRGRQVDIQSNKLGFEETKLAVEADKALLLLLEEGSSIAFPETVQVMRDDMSQVADRLSSTKVGTTTQGIEEEIIGSLEEMIEALQQAQRDLEEQQQQRQQQQQQGQPGDKPLVDKIAELKMIRALQMRVNTRTERYARRLEDSEDPIGQAEDDELRGFIENLADRQQRIQEVTRDIVLGKNR